MEVSPLTRMGSFDFDRCWHAECREGVDAPDGDGGFGDPGGELAGFDAGSDDGPGAGHGGFGAGSSVVAGLDFPGFDPDLGDAADGIATGSGRILSVWWRGDRGPDAGWDDGSGAARQDRGMAVKTVMALVGIDHGHALVDLCQQAGHLGAVVPGAWCQAVSQNHSRYRCQPPDGACAKPCVFPCRAGAFGGKTGPRVAASLVRMPLPPTARQWRSTSS